MSSGCARKDWITREEAECDQVVPGTPKRRDPPHRSSY